MGAPVDLIGMVQDGRGVPLPDALVIAWPKDKREGSVVQARSDAEGHFVLSRLLPGTWTLLAEAGCLGQQRDRKSTRMNNSHRQK